MRNAKTMNGIVHYVLFSSENSAYLCCPPPEGVIDNKIDVVPTDEPVDCIYCIANAPQAKKP